MSTERPCHFAHLLQVSNQCLSTLILYTFFNVFPGAGADNPLWTKFWCQQKGLVTLPICCKFQKKYLWSLVLYIFLPVFIHVYSPGAGQTTPWGQNFYFNIHLLSLWSFAVSSSIKWLSNSFSPYKSIRDQIWPCRKIGQGQPKVINHLNKLWWAQGPNATYEGPRSLALCFQRRRFWRVITIYGRGGHLGHVTQMPWTKLLNPRPMEAAHEIWLRLAQGFWRRRSLKMVDGWTYHERRTTEHAYTIKLTNEPKGSGELKTYCEYSLELPCWGD